MAVEITLFVPQEITGFLSMEVVHVRPITDGDYYRSKFSHVTNVVAAVVTEGVTIAVPNSPAEGLIKVFGSSFFGDDGADLVIFGY